MDKLKLSIQLSFKFLQPLCSSILTAADQFSSTLVFCASEVLIKLPKPVEGGEKAAALLTPFIDEEVAIARLAGEETEPEIRKKGDFCFR